MNNTQKLFNLAELAAQNAYCPYSNFAVGTAILADNQQFYSGCNVENIAYPNGTCAETGAIAAMINGGGKRITEILIYANSKELISPCGACCQRIAEFADSETKIHLADINGIQKTVLVSELLPLTFRSIEHE